MGSRRRADPSRKIASLDANERHSSRPLEHEALMPRMAAARDEIKKTAARAGQEALENEILKGAVEYSVERKWIAHSSLLTKDDDQ